MSLIPSCDEKVLDVSPVTVLVTMTLDVTSHLKGLSETNPHSGNELKAETKQYDP